MIGYYNPAITAAYSYNLGAQMAMNNIQAAQMMSTPVFGAGDSAFVNMDYPMVYGAPCFYAYPVFNPVGVGMYAAGKGLGSFLASPITALRDAINKRID